MAIREILIYPHPILSTPSREVREINDELLTLLDDMAETMYAAPGIGLAAPQVGVLLRVAVIDIAPEGEPSKLLEVINPTILLKDGLICMDEGCLSFPGISEEVDRAERVVVQAFDRGGEAYELDCGGLMSIALQHEIDHLDGVLLSDHISRLKRRLLRKEMLRKQEEGGDYWSPSK